MQLHFNHNSLRIRILLAMALMLAILVGVLLLLADTIIERGFREVEQREVNERVGQVANALDNSLAGLSRTARDYAFWDDTYAFVATGDPAYIEANLTELFFLNNNVSYVAIVNPNGQLIYNGAFDLKNEVELPPPAVLNRLGGHSVWFAQPEDHAGELAGLLVLDEGPLLIAAQPILTSLGEGPSAGTLLMGRALDEREIARLAELTRLPFRLHRLDDPTLAPELQSVVAALAASPSSVTMALDAQRILGASQVADLAGKPGVLLALELPREVYQLGQQARRDYMLVLLGVGLLFSVLVLWVIEVTVLRRMIALSRQVTAIKASRPETRVSVAGRDELGQLGEAINQMLVRLAQAQQQLVASEQRYRRLIELSPDATIIHDGQRIRYSNAAGARLLGSETPAALVDQPVDHVIAAVTPSDDGAPLLSEHMLTRPDGTLIEVELVALPFQERGAPATQVIVRNITERKQVEKALRSAKEAADVANRAKSQFLATMSHELRTPLAAIIGYAELLEQAVATAPLDELLHDIGRIRTAGAHLLALINDVLDLSKIEAGHMQVKATPLPLDLLLQTIIGTVQPLAAHNGNRLELRVGANLGLMLSDEVRLRQILLNLLSNACKFTHNGVVTLEVQVLEGADAGERLRFAVRDTGIGIAPAQQSQLFRDFVQIDSSSTRRYGGTGLGLALSQRLARLLGGAITVVSEPGAGSTFSLDLPRNYAGEDDLDQAAAPPALNDDTPSLAEMADAESRIVLVIDDDPAIRDLLPRMLAHPGLHFETAASGNEGLELAAALLPDLIILDVLLPDRDGWGVLQRLKADPDTCAIPVLMLTISPDAESGFILGAASVMHKPVDVKGLADEMALILSDRAEARRLLLVEDDADLRTYMRRTLEQGRWSVDEAPDAATALVLLGQHQPALAIIDLMLPDMDGIELIAAMRARPGGDTLPILVVTAKELTFEEQEQLNRSVEQVLRKGSFRSDELLRSARALVHRPVVTS